MELSKSIDKLDELSVSISKLMEIKDENGLLSCMVELLSEDKLHIAFGCTYHVEVGVNLIDESQLKDSHRGKIHYPSTISSVDNLENSSLPKWLKSSETFKYLSNQDYKHFRIVPIKNNEILLGLIVVAQKNTPTESMVIRSNILSKHASKILLSIVQEKQIDSFNKQLLAIRNITEAVSNSLDLRSISVQLLVKAKELFSVEAVGIFIGSKDSKVYRIYESVGLSRNYIDNIAFETGYPVDELLIKSDKPIQIYDSFLHAREDQKDVLKKEGLFSRLYAPIISNTKLVGILALYSKAPRHFIDDEMNFAKSLADQAAVAFSNAKLHTEMTEIINSINQTRNLMIDGMMELNTKLEVTYLNNAAKVILATSDIIPNIDIANLLKITKLFNEETIKRVKDAASKVIQGIKQKSILSTNEENVRFYEAVYSPNIDVKGSIIGVIINVRDLTQLYDEHDKLQTIHSNIEEGIILTDLQGNVIDHNNESTKILNIEPDIAGKSLIQVLEGSKINFDKDLEDLSKQVLLGKRHIIYGESDDIHLQFTFGPVVRMKEVIGLILTIRDITPLIEKTVEANEMAAKAKSHLRELSKLAELTTIIGFNLENTYKKYITRLNSLLDSTTVALYLYDPALQSLVLHASSGDDFDLQKQLKITENSIIAKSFVARKKVTEAIDSGIAKLVIPISHQSKNLGVIIVGRKLKSYGEHEARLLGLVATRLAVLVENANLFNEVNARRERWEAVFRFTDEGIVIFDRDSRIVGFNSAAVAITNFSILESIGKPFTKIIKTVSKEGLNMASSSPILKVLKEGVTITKSEQLIESKGGLTVWTEISYSPIFDDNGSVTSGIAIISNVQKDREIEEIKSDFISIVSHELRTPLTAIKGFLSMIIKRDFGSLTDKQSHYLSRVYQSNQRMIDLVEDLLESSNIESGQISLSISPVALENILSEVIAESAGKAASKQILIKVNRRQRLPLVLADETRLHQILINLVDNAIKYSSEDSEVRIDFKVSGDELITTVNDQGVGITSTQFDRLFTKFGRIYNSMSIQAGGTGLGLYIVKHLVESHGGRVWVTSREGYGSKFSFSLPIAKQLPLLK
jgi:PAS domain S-box-containing protein